MAAARNNHPFDVVASPLDRRAYLILGRTGRTGRRLEDASHFGGELRVPVWAARLERRDHAVLDPARLVLAQLRLGLDRR
jgi:hypothetical protein